MRDHKTKRKRRWGAEEIYMSMMLIEMKKNARQK